MKEAGNLAIYQERRLKLAHDVKKAHPTIHKGAIVLFGSFEHERRRFRQESSFYYFSGIEEAGLVLVIDLSGKTTLYIPHCSSRGQWVDTMLTPSPDCAKLIGVDEVAYLGVEQRQYHVSPLFNKNDYQDFLAVLRLYGDDGKIFTFCSANSHTYVEQKLILERLIRFEPRLEHQLIDIEGLVGRLRRVKSRSEIERMYKAVETTMVAHEAAARVIEPGIVEQDLRAGIEYIFAEAGGMPAFPSIVATGRHSTVLHYGAGTTKMKDGDLVVVDIGAEIDYYCADLTRTYPVSGTFSKRQKEVYKIVLATQEHIASLVKPGMWLKNNEKPELSLQHRAQQFLEKHGYHTYFPHGIGHFLGLDVHDVGDVSEPLQEGDVITIEPGIYIPKEALGIRIEDDYWIVKDGVVCLSEELAKDVEAVEEMAQSSMDFEEEGDDMDEMEDYQ